MNHVVCSLQADERKYRHSIQSGMLAERVGLSIAFSEALKTSSAEEEVQDQVVRQFEATFKRSCAQLRDEVLTFLLFAGRQRIMDDSLIELQSLWAHCTTERKSIQEATKLHFTEIYRRMKVDLEQCLQKKVFNAVKFHQRQLSWHRCQVNKRKVLSSASNSMPVNPERTRSRQI